MAKKEDIPYLITLLDDPDDQIRETIEQELLAFGPNLERWASPYVHNLESEVSDRLSSLFQVLRQQKFEQNWLNWLDIENDEVALEYAFSQLAYLDHGYKHPPLHTFLDQLAVQFLESKHDCTVPNLMQFVFKDLGFTPPQKAYYHPSNSNLVNVILKKEGIQISLSCICILLAPRLGLRIRGLNIPGHFMAFSTNEKGKIHIYDCFKQGESLSRGAVHQLEYSLGEQNKSLNQMEAKPYEIILRVLRNIINARIHNKGPRPDDFYKSVFDQLVQSLQDRGILLL